MEQAASLAQINQAGNLLVYATTISLFVITLPWMTLKRQSLKRYQVLLESLEENTAFNRLDFQHVFSHNFNTLYLKRLEQSLSLPSNSAYIDNVPKYGHCYASDMLINLMSLQNTALSSDFKILLLSHADNLFSTATLEQSY